MNAFGTVCAGFIIILSLIVSAWLNKDAASIWFIGCVTGMVAVALKNVE